MWNWNESVASSHFVHLLSSQKQKSEDAQSERIRVFCTLAWFCKEEEEEECEASER